MDPILHEVQCCNIEFLLYIIMVFSGFNAQEFRTKVMVLIKDVVFIVGSSSVFRQMFVALHADISWEQTESALFIMRAVAKNILP